MVSKNFIIQIQQHLKSHLNENITIENTEQVYGGDINETWKLKTNAENYFLKINDDVFADMFEKEFNGLQLLNKAGTIRVPKAVLRGSINGSIFLLMEFITKGSPGKDFWKKFAEDLAGLHRYTQKKFGLDEDNYIGSLQQKNELFETWCEFYATQRIVPLVKMAYEQNKCPKEEIATIEKLCSKFSVLIPEEKPSLLHGDLWSGNFISDENGLPVVYDPAVYYGHREMDIAMTLLFGGFDRKFYHYYNEVFPLQQGWQQRIDLCQLYPLLVHLVLFGGHYYYSVSDIVRKYA